MVSMVAPVSDAYRAILGPSVRVAFLTTLVGTLAVTSTVSMATALEPIKTFVLVTMTPFGDTGMEACVTCARRAGVYQHALCVTNLMLEKSVMSTV